MTATFERRSKVAVVIIERRYSAAQSALNRRSIISKHYRFERRSIIAGFERRSTILLVIFERCAISKAK